MTGGTGLVGTHLLRQLVSEGRKVKALYRSAFPAFLTKEEIEKIEWVKGDVLDAHTLFHSLDGIQQVYHAAALVSFNPYRKKELFKIRVYSLSQIIDFNNQLKLV